MSITKAERAAIKDYMARRTIYDPDTLRVFGGNELTVKRDADKTFDAPETERLFIGTVTDFLAEMAADKRA